MASPIPYQVLSAEDIRAIANPSAGGGDGSSVSIVGFGSLLSERSTRMTFPRATDFRIAQLRGFRRVFGHVAPIFLRRGLHRVDDAGILRAASLSIEPLLDLDAESQPPLCVTLFEIPVEEVGAFLEREEEFEILRVAVEDNENITPTGLACGASTDERYRELRLGESPESIAAHPSGVAGTPFYDKFAKYDIGHMWRADGSILPCDVYLRHCLLAAEALGQAELDNFLDTTILADRTTVLRDYVDRNPEIMDVVPPPEFVGRYSG